MASGFNGKRYLLGENNLKLLGKITRKYIGKSFNECNCVQLVYWILEDAGIHLHSSYKGYNLTNYMKYWFLNKSMMTKILLEWVETMGRYVDPRYLKAGDILVVKCKSDYFIGIYTGGGKILCSTIEKGVINTTMNRYTKIIKARRIL